MLGIILCCLFVLAVSCPDDLQCDENAICLQHNTETFTCHCKVGWAGDGKVCGPDKDLDGFPDAQLDCDHLHCQKDNCLETPNSGQEDSDADGVGDACDQSMKVFISKQVNTTD